MVNSASIAKDVASGKVSMYIVFVTGVFAILFALSFADRQIIGVIAEPMKAALGLTDVQIGLMGGLGFVICFVCFGLPLGRLADTYNRKVIIMAGVIIWSTSTVLCAFATQFWELLVLRMGVGFGEAALGPCAYSILADILPRNRLAMALSFCTMAGAVGMGLAYSGGGMLLHWGTAAADAGGMVALPVLGRLEPWRAVFVGVGLPGIALCALLLAIREPSRPVAAARAAIISAREVISYIQLNWRTFALHNVGMGFISITGYTASLWDITFFARTYEWPASESARLYGVMAMVGSVVGALSGGWLADRLTMKRGRDAKLLVLGVTAVLCIPIRILYPLMPSRELALSLSFIAVTLVAVPYGVAASALQIMAPSRMRGQVTALYFFVQSLIGLGIGPTTVGLLTDHVFRNPQMLRYSLVITGGVAQIGAAALFLFALRPYQTTLVNAVVADCGARTDGPPHRLRNPQ